MSNFFDDYLKLNPIENEPAKEKEKPVEDDPKEDESNNGGDLDDE